MKIYDKKTEKIRLEQKEKEIQKKEIKKETRREQQSQVKTWGSFKRIGLNTRGRKVNSKVLYIRQSTRYIH